MEYLGLGVFIITLYIVYDFIPNYKLVVKKLNDQNETHFYFEKIEKK